MSWIPSSFSFPSLPFSHQHRNCPTLGDVLLERPLHVFLLVQEGAHEDQLVFLLEGEEEAEEEQHQEEEEELQQQLTEKKDMPNEYKG